MVVKNGVMRDQLADQYGVLCFETEAAGAFFGLPCIVIRGIADYCDTHKNDEWHGYAAAAAAAYARQIFFHLPIDKVEHYISSAIEDGMDRLVKRQDNKEHREIADWLTLADYATQQSNFIARRQEGTGQWLLDSEKFQEWLTKSSQTLFCPVLPGAGKTMLVAIIIDHLLVKFGNNHSIGIAYLYCDYRQQQEQKPTELLMCLLKQLVQDRESIPENVKSLYQRHKAKRTRPSLNEVSEVIHSVITNYSRVFIIIDALDECQVTNGDCQKLLSEIFNLQAKTTANLLITSRYISVIMEEFEQSISLEIRARDEDVKRYLDEHIRYLPSFVLRNVGLQKEIEADIIKAADGMFLLVELYLKLLSGSKSPKATIIALKKLPTGSEAYGYAYKKAMERIEGQNPRSVELAKQVLSWMTCSKKRLHTLELQHALAVEIGEPELDELNFPEVEDIVSVCAGLVTVDKENNTVRLVHYTAQEYFERTSRSWFFNARSCIAMTCVTYLSFDVFAVGICRTREELESRVQLNVLYDYAARNWGYHTYAASIQGERSIEKQSIVDFLESDVSSTSSQVWIDPRNKRYPFNSVPDFTTGLHLAACFGLEEVIETFLENGYHLDFEDFCGRTPLSWAAQKGHQAVVERLLAIDGVNPDSKDKHGKTPLSWAAEEGHKAVVELLLSIDGVDPNSKNTNCMTPLSWAVYKGHEAIMQLLLPTDRVNLDSGSSLSRTPLVHAAIGGQVAIVKLLLQQDGLDINAKHDCGETLLSRAAINGRNAVVKLLLTISGVDPDCKDYWARMPLSWAAEKGYTAIAELLLARHDVNPNSKDIDGRTPLSFAARKGRKMVVKLLLTRHDVDSRKFHTLKPSRCS